MSAEVAHGRCSPACGMMYMARSLCRVLASPRRLPLSLCGRLPFLCALPLKTHKRAHSGGGAGAAPTTRREGTAQRGARAQHEDSLVGVGEEGGTEENAGDGRPFGRGQGTAENREDGARRGNSSGGATPAVGQGKRGKPASLRASLGKICSFLGKA